MRLLTLFCCFSLLPVAALAIDPLLSLKIGEAENKLLAIERALNDPAARVQISVLKELQEQGLFVKNVANECIERNETSINKSAQALELLGEQSVTDETEVTDKRQSLNQDMLSSAQQLASCRLLLLRSHEMVDVALTKQQQVLASELLAKQYTLLDNVKFNLLHPLEIVDAIIDFAEADSGWSVVMDNAVPLVALLIVALGIILLLRRWMSAALRRHDSDQHSYYLGKIQFALLFGLHRHLPALVLLGTYSLFYLYRWSLGKPWDFIGLVVIGLFGYAIANLIIRIQLNAAGQAPALTDLPRPIAQLMARRLRLLIKLLLIGMLLYAVLQLHQFSPQITGMIRNIYLFLLVLNLIWAIWLLRFFQGISQIPLLRAALVVGLLVCLAADWAGYTNLAEFILLGITGTLLAWIVTIFVLRLWTDFLDSLDEGRNEWQRRFRKRIGVKSGAFIPGSIWFRFSFALIIWSVFAVVLLKIWGLPDASLILLKDTVVQGVEIGNVRVVPLKIIIALLSFATLLSIIGWIKRRMDKSWLQRSRMERGAKEATISLTSYFAVAIAFLIALSIAGFELANIALIAGALSVGIGFGLQNIVNNFVSGVILLFERPIKTGDWISVGGTEGYVRKISIRSTQIQTFDRSDVIVPNSELISGQVTNLMLRDSIGRIIVPVGVAYGTDPERVRDILLDIAHQHPDVISSSPILSKPWVLFREFGDSSLNFELRCYVRDVDSRLSIISAINFEIDKAFREAGIEIPFPQRDVHIVNSKDQKVITNDA